VSDSPHTVEGLSRSDGIDKIQSDRFALTADNHIDCVFLPKDLLGMEAGIDPAVDCYYFRACLFYRCENPYTVRMGRSGTGVAGHHHLWGKALNLFYNGSD
jgi:hypothetical protein